MAGPQQRYRGVRQRHWGSWVSEIRHPVLKTRIWLGTFETAEDAARAYDEAARLMCGPKTRMNFGYEESSSISSSSSSSSTKYLSATLRAKLQKCHQLAEKKESRNDHQVQAQRNDENVDKSDSSDQQLTLEDDEIEQMIQELLHCGSFELSDVLQNC